MTIDLSRKPYYDDYDENKKFYKILYRPGYAVQARELNQTQTLIQKQVERLGSHLFKNGSVVIPGGFSVDTDLDYIKITLPDTFDESNLQSIVGLTITDGDLSAKIMAAMESEGADPTTLYVKYDSSLFDFNQTLTVSNGLQITDIVGVGIGSAAVIKAGIYFVNGYFLATDDEIFILDKYSNSPSYEVGFEYTETIVTADTDASLYEMAIGSPNYNAPGADRLKIEMVPSKRTLGSTEEDSNFVKMFTIENGEILTEFRDPQYNVLTDTLAKGTYDESGNYVIDPFVLKLREHLRTNTNGGAYYPEQGGDSTKFVSSLDAGLAYVNGYSVETISDTNLTHNKARSTRSVQNGITSLRLGNYIKANFTNALPEISNFPTVNLLDVSSNVIGTLRIRTVEKNEDDSYNVFIFDVRMNDTYSFDTDVVSLSQTISGGTFTATTIPVNGINVVYDAGNSVSVFNLPYNFISTISPNNLNDTTFKIFKEFTGLVSGSVVTPSGTFTVGAQFSSIVNEPFTSDFSSYSLVNLTAGYVYSLESSDFVFDSNNSTVYIDLTGQPNTTDPGVSQDNLRLIAVNQILIASYKTKTLNASYEDTINTGYGSTIQLRNADIFELISVTEDQDSTEVDVTDRFILDNGQRDEFYDLGSLKLRPGSTLPTGELTVTYSYFSHIGSGDYFAVDSYAGSGVDYTDIPTYTSSQGITYNLSDAYDFRPRINNAQSGFTGTGASSARQFSPFSEVIADFSYYLPRIDKIVLHRNGVFEVREGVSAEIPTPPADITDGITLYTLNIPPYTGDVTEIVTSTNNYKRYTMRDIGNLESRIKSLEYYVSLNLLEQETENLKILDSTGNDKFKNGFLVDNFTGYSASDITNDDFGVAINTDEQTAQPQQILQNVSFTNKLTKSQLESSNIKLHDDGVLTLTYDEVTEIDQPLASNTISVNPYSTFFFPGTMTVTPDRDTWFSTTTEPSSTTTTETTTTTSQQIYYFGRGRLRRFLNLSWLWYRPWIGIRPQYYLTSLPTVSSTDTSSTDKVVNDRSISTTNTPYVRSKAITLKAVGMQPSTDYYIFFDGVNVTSYCDETPTSDIYGNVEVTFTIPSDDTAKFTAGVKNIFLTNAASTNRNDATSYASAQYTVEGTTDSSTTTKCTETDSNTSGSESNVVSVSLGRIFRIPLALRLGNPFLSTDVPIYSGRLTGTTTFTLKVLSVYRDKLNYFQERFNNVLPNVRFKAVVKRYGVSSNSNIVDIDLGALSASGESHTFTLSPPASSDAFNLARESEEDMEYQILISQNDARLFSPWIQLSIELVTTANATESTSTRAVDPIAQSFALDTSGGAFITSIETFFSAKDDVLPVVLNIREMENGFPTKTLVPGSSVTLAPDAVSISDDASVSTEFKFTSPIYLRENVEYCFVVLSNSDEYKIWYASTTNADTLTKLPITKQPSTGVMFKSQNDSTWTEDQASDVKFKINRANFDSSGTVAFIPESNPDNEMTDADPFIENLVINPFETTSGSPIVTVFQPGHGYITGDQVTIEGFSSNSVVNGIPVEEVAGTHSVTLVDVDRYTFTTTTNASLSGQAGGSYFFASKVVTYDNYTLNTTQLQPPGTGISWQVANKLQSGGVSGITRDSFVSVTPKNPIVAPSTYQIVPSSVTNTELSCLISTTNSNISPVLNVNAVDMICIRNRINNSSSDPIAQYITSPVVLNTPAKAIKVIFDANRPANTTIRVFAKIKTVGDSTDFSSLPYTELTVNGILPQANTNLTDFTEYEFDFSSAVQFSTFAVKVTLTSTDTTRVPRLSRMRAIATAS